MKVDFMDTPRRFRHLPSTVYLVKSLEAVNRLQTDKILRDSPITIMQYVALGVLQNSSQGMTSAALARRSFVTPQSMQDIIRGLESKSMIARSRSETNKREMNISLSQKGEEILTQLEPAMADLNEQLLDGFSDAEVEMFRSLLQRARSNVKNFSPTSE